MQEHLEMWTVFDHPADFPDVFVARKFVIEATQPVPRLTNDIVTSSSLDAVRREMRMRGLTCLTRSPEDQFNIVETWF